MVVYPLIFVLLFTAFQDVGDKVRRGHSVPGVGAQLGQVR